ncbi:MAG: MFS transporter [Candidatus Woesearchaeota archaeon]
MRKKENNEPFIMSDSEVERNLNVSIIEGMFASLFTGFTKSFIAPLAIAMQATNTMVAAFSSLPDLLASFFQLFSVKATQIFKSRRNIIIAANILQAIVWIPIALVPFIAANNVYLLLGLVTFSVVISQFIQPVWNSLIGEIVPEHRRGKFFGTRNLVVGASTFSATLIAGLVLNHYSSFHPLIGFSIIFGIAILARLISAYFKMKLADLPFSPKNEKNPSLLQFLSKMQRDNYGIFVFYVGLLKFSVYLAAPFFAIYMLKVLNFTYWQFTLITCASVVSSFIFMVIWGGYLDKHGSRKTLFITGSLVFLIPLLWVFALFTTSGKTLFAFLFFIEMFSGIIWAGFDLGAANFIFDAVDNENRIRYISYYNLLVGIAVFAGTSVGSLFVDKMDGVFGLSGIILVFILSGFLRVLVSLVFLPRLKEVRLIEVPIGHTFFHRIVDIQPRCGFTFEVLEKGPKITKINLKEDSGSFGSLNKGQKNELHGKGTVDLLKEHVVEETTKKSATSRISQTKIDENQVDEIMHDIQRGKFPKEFKQRRS